MGVVSLDCSGDVFFFDFFSSLHASDTWLDGNLRSIPTVHTNLVPS